MVDVNQITLNPDLGAGLNCLLSARGKKGRLRSQDICALSYARAELCAISLNLTRKYKMTQVNTSALNNPMAIAKGALVKAQVISTEIATLITKGTKKSIDASKTKKQTVDLMETSGLKSYDLDLSNKEKAPLCDSIKGAIVLGFDLDAQALLAKESKTLGDLEKATKRALQQQIGSEFAYYRRALVERERIAIEGKAEKSTPEQMYFKGLQAELERLGKLENVSFDLVAHKSALKKLLADK